MKHPTFVCRKAENTALIKCICGRCEAEKLRAENSLLQSHHTALKTRIGELEYWIECELEWMDCRGDEDCDHCVGVWLLAESSKPLPGSDSNPPHPAEKGSGT